MRTARGISRRGFLAGAAAGSAATALSALGCAPRRTAVHAGTLSPVELTRACLERIERLDRRLNAFITVTAERALAAARNAEREVTGGRWRGPLHGIPIAVKDNIDTAGVRTTAASAAYAERVPDRDADVIQRLLAAGAIVLGKTNMHELALGTTSAISHAGPVRNPWDLERVAGGSSGGSGAAVAAALCFGAVGTDTGGSVRIPAACCGIVGFKPTLGVVSTRGVVPVSTSFDHVGPMCRTVGDAALMFAAMIEPGRLGFDPAALPSVAALRVGVARPPGNLCDEPVAPEIQAAVDAAIEVIRSLVAEIGAAELAAPDLGRIIEAEVYAAHGTVAAAMPDRFDPRTRGDIVAGKAIALADYERMRGELARHRASIHQAFSTVDLIVLPTLPRLPMILREATAPFGQTACTFPFSIGGLPAISIPCGVSSSGLPIGLLIGGPPGADARVLALAHAYERATDWHRRRPPL